jgi:hypothetical protein
MRVNLIHSKLISFFKKIQKLNTLKKRKKIHSNSASELHCARKHRILQSSYSPKHEIAWDPLELNYVFSGTKYYVCCGCFKRRSNHANKRPLNLLVILNVHSLLYVRNI